MRQHFHRCPNLRVVTVDVSDISGARKGGSIILDELCEANALARCVGLADCDTLTDGQRRELLVTRVTNLRERSGGPSELGDFEGARKHEIAELAEDFLVEHTEILDANRRMLAEATAAFDDRADDAPIGTAEDLALPDLGVRSPELRTARLDAIDRALEQISEGPFGYGVCVRCKGAIDLVRLRATPDTHVCGECAASARPVE